jgi:hypothetical protein
MDVFLPRTDTHMTHHGAEFLRKPAQVEHGAGRGPKVIDPIELKAR